MEKALEDAKGAAPSRESMIALADTFRYVFYIVSKNVFVFWTELKFTLFCMILVYSASADRAGKSAVQYKQVS